MFFRSIKKIRSEGKPNPKSWRDKEAETENHSCETTETQEHKPFSLETL